MQEANQVVGQSGRPQRTGVCWNWRVGFSIRELIRKPSITQRRNALVPDYFNSLTGEQFHHGDSAPGCCSSIRIACQGAPVNFRGRKSSCHVSIGMMCLSDDTPGAMLCRGYLMFSSTHSHRQTFKTEGLDQGHDIFERNPVRKCIRTYFAEQCGAHRI